MANSAVKLVRTEFRSARAFGAPATISPDPIHDTTLEEARSKAREWADKAIDLYQVGDTEQTRSAVRLAEAWLARMHAFQAPLRNQPGSAIEPQIRAPRAESGIQDSAEICVRPLVVLSAASPLIADHVKIRKNLLSRRDR
jgi:hypothetical protein